MSQLSIDIMLKKANVPTRFELYGLKIDKLKPCPFCGNNEIHLEEDILQKTPKLIIQYWLRCFCCGGDGPPFSSRLGAIKKWNDRK